MGAGFLVALLPYATRGAFVVAVFALMIAVLPDGVDYPFPAEAAVLLRDSYTALYTLNILLPVDTFIEVIYYAFYMLTFTRVIYPIGFWLMKTVTGGGE